MEEPANYKKPALQWAKDWNNPDEGLGPKILPAQPAEEVIARATEASFGRVEVMAEYHAGPHNGGYVAEVYRATAARLLAEAERLSPAPLATEGAGLPFDAAAFNLQFQKRVDEGRKDFAKRTAPDGDGRMDVGVARFLVACNNPKHEPYLSMIQGLILAYDAEKATAAALTSQLQDTEAARVAAEAEREKWQELADEASKECMECAKALGVVAKERDKANERLASEQAAGAEQERQMLELVKEVESANLRLEVVSHYINRDADAQIAEAYAQKRLTGLFPWEDGPATTVCQGCGQCGKQEGGRRKEEGGRRAGRWHSIKSTTAK